MGDGTSENPYTREDVLRLIEENGGNAEGVDLSGKVFEEGIDLGNLDLDGIILNKALLKKARFTQTTLRYAELNEAVLTEAFFHQSTLRNSHLKNAELFRTHLVETELSEADLEGAWLFNAQLEKVDLWGANLESSHLRSARFEGCLMRLVRFSLNTELADVDWGNYKIAEENIGNFDIAADTYRHLKLWHNLLGIYDVAGEFFFREMTSRRNKYWWGDKIEIPPQAYAFDQFEFKRFPKYLFPKKPFRWAWSKLISMLCGYGEKPERVVVSALVIILGLAIAYSIIGTLVPNSFMDSLYYSFVSFTAVGYGAWVKESFGWVKWLGVTETLIGVFMMALFLVTFTRKMTR